jgi:hypothetical protein
VVLLVLLVLLVLQVLLHGRAAEEDADVAAPLRDKRPLTLEDLLLSSRDEVPVRCNHCGRDGADREYEMVQDALRGRIRALEAKVRDLEAMLVSRN